MAENIVEIFWMLDAKSKRVLYVSPAYETITGRSCASIYKEPLSYREVIHPEDRLHVLTRLDEILASNTFDEEFRIVHADGTIRWIWNRGFLVRNKRDRVYRIVGTALDVTLRKVAEAALRDSEERYRDLVEHSEDLICTHDLDGRLLSVNELPARLLGYSQAELLSKPMRELLAPEYREQFDDYLLTIERDGAASGFLAVLTKSGNRRIWEYHNTLRTLHAGPRIVRGIAHDVTEQKRMESELKRSEEKFSKAFRSSPAAKSITTLEEGYFIDVNLSFEQLCGYQRDELIGRTSLDVGLLASTSPRELIIETLKREGSVRDVETEIRHKSGKLRTVRWSAELIEIRGERFLLSFGEDITRRKETELQLLEKTAYLDSLIRESPIAILVYDSEGRITMCNPAFERLFQYRFEEICGVNLDKLLAPQEFLTEAEEYTRLTLSGENVHASGSRKRKDGQLIDVEIHGVQFKADGVRMGGYVVYLDLSVRKQLQEQVWRSQKMEAVAHVAAGIAHDFNNLLTGILGFGELLAKSLVANADQHKRAELIIAAAIRGRVITSQLLSMSTPGLSKPKVLAPINLIRYSEPILRLVLGEDINLSILDHSNQAAVRIDPDQFLQVLMNLALNARDAMPTGGQCTIEISSMAPLSKSAIPDMIYSDASFLVISFSDSGCGMDSETQAHIFEPFFTTKIYGKGTGLGLWSVAGIVKHFGGYLGVESAPGRGSCFQIFLPRTSMAPTAESDRLPGSVPHQKMHTILLVEDDDVVRQMAEELFRLHGHHVLSAKNGLHALSVAHEQAGPIDLLVSDVVMPQMSGPELAKRLKRQRCGLKVLFISGYAEERLLPHFRSGRPYPVLRKPFREGELIEAVNATIDSD